MRTRITSVVSLFNFDALHIALKITWVWAWLGLQLTKLFEFAFKMVLLIPDKWITIPEIFNIPIRNSAGQNISLLTAYNEFGCITNKVKLFVQWFWENVDENSIYNTNGFDVRKLFKMLNCSALYCSYLINNTNEEIKPEEFYSKINYLFAGQVPNNESRKKRVLITHDPNFSHTEETSLGHVDFEESKECDESKESRESDEKTIVEQVVEEYTNVQSVESNVYREIKPEIQQAELDDVYPNHIERDYVESNNANRGDDRNDVYSNHIESEIQQIKPHDIEQHIYPDVNPSNNLNTELETQQLEPTISSIDIIDATNNDIDIHSLHDQYIKNIQNIINNIDILDSGNVELLSHKN